MISGSDWVSFGVLYYKSCQTSKAGNSYTLCKLTDLQTAGAGCGDIASVTVFFFGAAHTRHYKIPLNKVVGILNAKVGRIFSLNCLKMIYGMITSDTN